MDDAPHLLTEPMIPDGPLALVATPRDADVVAVVEALAPPAGACVGVEVREEHGDLGRLTAWWRVHDLQGRPLAERTISRDARGSQLEWTSSWIHTGARESREDRGDGFVARTEATWFREGRPVRRVGAVDRGWGSDWWIDRYRYDADGREIVHTARTPGVRQRYTTEHGPGGAALVSWSVGNLSFVVDIQRIGSEEIRTTRCEALPNLGSVRRIVRDSEGRVASVTEEGFGPARTWTWTWDGFGRPLAMRHSSGSGRDDVEIEWLRAADGTLLGSVETTTTRRVVRAFEAGCGEEPDPERDRPSG